MPPPAGLGGGDSAPGASQVLKNPSTLRHKPDRPRTIDEFFKDRAVQAATISWRTLLNSLSCRSRTDNLKSVGGR